MNPTRNRPVVSVLPFICAEKVDMPSLFWDPLLKAATLGQLNLTKDAGKMVDQLTQLMPDAYSEVRNILESFLLSQDLNNEILEGLRKAWLNKAPHKSNL